MDDIKHRYIEFITKEVHQRFNQYGLYYTCNHVLDIQQMLGDNNISLAADVTSLINEIEQSLKVIYGSCITFNRSAREIIVFVRGFVVHTCMQMIITKG